jgi:hypothetical protein
VHFRQAIAVTLKEIQKIITANASDTSVAIFKLAKLENQDIFVPFQARGSFSAGSRWDDAENSPTCLLFARNLQQWKACVCDLETIDPDILYPKAQKVFQKFAPLFVTNQDGPQFVPRQRLLVANLSDKEVRSKYFKLNSYAFEILIIGCDFHLQLVKGQS